MIFMGLGEGGGGGRSVAGSDIMIRIIIAESLRRCLCTGRKTRITCQIGW